MRKKRCESLKKVERCNRTSAPLSSLIYLWGEGRRKSERQEDHLLQRLIASGGFGMTPMMSTWESGRSIDGGRRVWPHQRPVPPGR